MDGVFRLVEERGPRGCLMNMVDDASGIHWHGWGEDDLGGGGMLWAWVKNTAYR
jgi:hypothetical protein